MSKMFNALNGQELKMLIRKEVEQQIALDPRFESTEGVLTSALLVFSLRVDWYPGGEQPIQVSVSHRFTAPDRGTWSPAALRPMILTRIQQELDGDLQFSQNLTYPRVTYSHLLDLTLTRRDGGVVERSVHAAPILEGASKRRGTGDPLPPERIVDLRTPPHQVPPPSVVDPREARVAELRRQITEIESGPVDPTPAAAPMSPTETRHRDFEPYTGSGLPLTYGFQEGPGPSAAASYGEGSKVGALQTPDVAERITLGVRHPPLDDGGVGAPDAVRRAAGLPVPETTSRGGQIYDIPLGTF